MMSRRLEALHYADHPKHCGRADQSESDAISIRMPLLINTKTARNCPANFVPMTTHKVVDQSQHDDQRSREHNDASTSCRELKVKRRLTRKEGRSPTRPNRGTGSP